MQIPPMIGFISSSDWLLQRNSPEFNLQSSWGRKSLLKRQWQLLLLPLLSCSKYPSPFSVRMIQPSPLLICHPTSSVIQGRKRLPQYCNTTPLRDALGCWDQEHRRTDAVLDDRIPRSMPYRSFESCGEITGGRNEKHRHTSE